MADLVVTATSVLKGANATLGSGIAGEALTAGKAVYLKASDSRYYLAQCDGTAEESTVAGIALHAAGVAQPIQFQTGGTMNIGATTAKTTAYVLSAAAGGIAPQADLVGTNRIVYVGYATDTTGTFVLNRIVTCAVV